MTPYGLLNLNKPPGITSRKVVDHVQRVVRPARAGHAGTLDPLATGVLVVCVGPATRLIQFVQRMPKTYVGTFLLGRTSPTEDVDSEVTELPNPAVPSHDQILAAAERFVGQIQQRPPAYSALKVQGQRAYKLARKEAPFELKPRPVTIHRIEVLQYAYPAMTLEIECGSGTYVRSLGRDLAESLGTAAVMSALERTAIGSFRIEEAIDLEQVSETTWISDLLPPFRAVEALPQVELSPEEAQRIRNGQTIDRPVQGEETGELAAVDDQGRLLAVLIRRGDHLLGPLRNLPPV